MDVFLRLSLTFVVLVFLVGYMSDFVAEFLLQFVVFCGLLE